MNILFTLISCFRAILFTVIVSQTQNVIWKVTAVTRWDKVNKSKANNESEILTCFFFHWTKNTIRIWNESISNDKDDTHSRNQVKEKNHSKDFENAGSVNHIWSRWLKFNQRKWKKNLYQFQEIYPVFGCIWLKLFLSSHLSRPFFHIRSACNTTEIKFWNRNLCAHIP